MKRKTLIIMLVCEAALLFILVLLTNQFPGLFSSMFAFPFEQIAIGLKALSQTGQVGNGLATALWVGLSLLPSIPAFHYKQNKASIKERITLFSLSWVLLLALYGMINPHVFCSFIPEAKSEYLAVVKAVMGVSVWSVIVLYVVLRLIRMFGLGDKVSLLKYMQLLLHILCLLFAAVAVISFGRDLTASIFASQKSVETLQNALDNMIDLLRRAAASVPYVLNIAIIMSTLNLFDIVMTEDQNGIVNAAEKLSKICCIALGITAALTAFINILQIILMRLLSSVATTVDIPIGSIVFVGIVLLLSRLLVENKRLRDDNSLFI